MNAIAKVLERSNFTWSCEVPREMSKACSTTRPPRLCATKMTGRSLYISKHMTQSRRISTYRIRFRSSQGKVLSKRLPVVAYGVSAGDVKQLDYICIVSKGKDAHVFEVICEKILGPEDGSLVRPCGFAITCEAMDEYDTEMCVRHR
jgi:hypothetical protein